MNRNLRVCFCQCAQVLLAAALVPGVFAQNVQHLSTNLPGGMPGTPVITGINLVSNGLKVTWDGPSGYYQLFEAASTNEAWRALTRKTDLLRNAVLPSRYSNAFFRVSGPSPQYAGAETCAGCHGPILNTEIHTLHAVAFSNVAFASCGGQTNSSCLACHTVGFDLPTGFVSQAQTPSLAGVQCENCHGPAGLHAANPSDPLVRPRVEVASTVCGGCHSDSQHPTYEEWTNSAHAQVVEDMNPASRINACGRCHSGSVRLSLLENMALPVGDADVAIVCATCHDPHQTNGYTAQLRNPVASTNDYFMPTNGTFASYYNPQINVCAQCHNHAGASWTNNLSEPHHSLQYNMLLGSVGELDYGPATYRPGTHALAITNQCVGCHMQSSSYVSETQPAVTGHSFKVETYNLCLNCHPLPEQLVAFTTNDVANQVLQVKVLLDYWATNKAPAALAKYGALAWEYTNPGNLSANGAGPDAAEQALIPENIRKARFDLYLVQNDGSFGVHNPTYVITLLQTAAGWIEAELDP